MSSDSELAEMGRDMQYIRRRRRELYGKPCANCLRLLPRANPSILLPGQKCKCHTKEPYRDPRPKITREQENAIWAERGYKRVTKKEKENG